jgi:hypothetical protein
MKKPRHEEDDKDKEKDGEPGAGGTADIIAAV